jgi:molybdate transport system substrate-binding protein
MIHFRSVLVTTLGLLVLLIAGLMPAEADELRVAVATNFAGTARILGRQFEAETGHDAIFVFGSTGKHYAQILHGAPFDVFLAADAKRPGLLEAHKKIVAGSRFTYAVGRIGLWSADEQLVDPQGLVLGQRHFRRLSIADPELAPYGRAAREALIALGHWNDLEARIVRGKNIGQAFQFVSTRNAELGIVAVSQLTAHDRGSAWIIPDSLYAPIEQQAVLLHDRPIGHAFLEFLNSSAARTVIRANGYGTL